MREFPVWYSAAVTTSPSASNAMAEGTMKNAICRSPASSRRRSCAPTSAWSPSALDMAGSSAADTAMPNRLTGSMLMDCALVSPATAPSPSLLASNWSTYPLICTTPRLTNTGAKLRNHLAHVPRARVQAQSQLAASAAAPPATAPRIAARCRPPNPTPV